MTAVCYFGAYNPGYVRNRVLRNGLRLQGVEVIECNSRKPGAAKFLSLWRVSRTLRGRCQALLVGFPGATVMPLAWLIGRRLRVPIIFDAFTSQYDAMVNARQKVRPKTPSAAYYRWLDRISCRLADAVLIDTNTHAEYLARLTSVERKKFHTLYVGTDIADIPPAPVPPAPPGKFLVHFHGHYTPFQGAEVIVRAAHLLRDVPMHFRLIGRGQQYTEVVALAMHLGVSNVEFIADVDYPHLAGFIRQADLCLGVFGGGSARPVIPNKVIEAMALGKPVLTGHLPAMDELFTAHVHLAYCRRGDPDDLAEQLRKLYRDEQLRRTLAANGQRLAAEQLAPKILGQELHRIISGLIR